MVTPRSGLNGPIYTCDAGICGHNAEVFRGATAALRDCVYQDTLGRVLHAGQGPSGERLLSNRQTEWLRILFAFDVCPPIDSQTVRCHSSAQNVMIALGLGFWRRHLSSLSLSLSGALAFSVFFSFLVSRPIALLCHH
eukprot:2917625-Rhodomonas_salina.1